MTIDRSRNWVDGIIEKITAADIKKDDWLYYIFEPESTDIPAYWMGYFEHYFETLTHSLLSDSEDFRIEILERLRCIK